MFIGLTKALPTKLSLIGLSFNNNEKIFGWFLIVITVFLLINFLVVLSLDLTQYFKRNLINKKARKFTGETLGMTYDEIGEEYERQDELNHEQRGDERTGSLGDEADDIKAQIKELENSFDKKHLTFQNIVELLFHVIVPVIVAALGLKYLYCFLLQ